MCVYVNYYMVFFDLEKNFKYFMMSFIMWLLIIEFIVLREGLG